MISVFYPLANLIISSLVFIESSAITRSAFPPVAVKKNEVVVLYPFWFIQVEVLA